MASLKKTLKNLGVLMPGTAVKTYGKIGTVVWTGGERYYMCIDKKGTVSLMPAETVERQK